MQMDDPQDFAIATGQTYSLREFVEETFSALDLDWQQHVDTDPALMRPTDLSISRADPAKAKDRLGWEATLRMPDVIRLMIKADLDLLSTTGLAGAAP